MNTIPPKPTKNEIDELATLRQRIFKGQIFLVVTPEIEATDEYKRYDELANKLRQWLAYCNQASVEN